MEDNSKEGTIHNLQPRIRPERAKKLDEWRTIEADPIRRPTHWGAYEGTTENYDFDFSYLFDRKGLRDLIQEKRESLPLGTPIDMLDLMADTSAVRSLPVDAGLALGLVDTRTPENRAIDKEKNIDMLAGDVLDPQSWVQIDKHMSNLGIKFFDLVTCHPVAGIYSILDTKDVDFLFHQAYSRLDENDGTFVTQLPIFMDDRVEEYIARIKNLGINADFTYGDGQRRLTCIYTTRNPDSPKTLPSVE